MTINAPPVAFEDATQPHVQKYGQYNGFYARADVRQIIYDLYKGKCAATGEDVALCDAEVGHIVPRSKPDEFQALYPGLDVDNVINLHLIKRDINRRNSDGIVMSPLAIHNAISFSAQVVDARLKKIMAKTQEQDDYEWVKAQLGEKIEYDLTPHYDEAICFGDYHAIPYPKVPFEALVESLGTQFHCSGKQRLINHPQAPIFLYWIGKQDSYFMKKVRKDFETPENNKGRDLLPDGDWVILPNKAKTGKQNICYVSMSDREKTLSKWLKSMGYLNDLLSQNGRYVWADNEDLTDFHQGYQGRLLPSERSKIKGCDFYKDGRLWHGYGLPVEPVLLSDKIRARATGTILSKADIRIFKKHAIKNIERMIDELGLVRPQSQPSETPQLRVR